MLLVKISLNFWRQENGGALYTSVTLKNFVSYVSYGACARGEEFRENEMYTGHRYKTIYIYIYVQRSRRILYILIPFRDNY